LFIDGSARASIVAASLIFASGIHKRTIEPQSGDGESVPEYLACTLFPSCTADLPESEYTPRIFTPL
jgi:hypothetical protein